MVKYVIIIKEKGDYMIYQALYRKYRPKTFNDVLKPPRIKDIYIFQLYFHNS